MTPDVTQARARDVNLAHLLQRICVRPPYFALRGLRHAEGVLEATALAELPAGREVGPMRAAEISRHAAIAGLCAAALGQGDHERRYYLAQEARYEGFESDARDGALVGLHARLLRLSKREALASIIATAGGSPIARLEVRYAVLGAPAFERLFREQRQETPARRTMGTVSPGKVTRAGGTLLRTLGPIPVEACAGHFEGYPAMPVAVLMGELAELAGDALGDGTSRYRTVRGRVEAQDFCWAGERVELTATPMSAVDDQVTLACSAHAGDRTAATMQVTLERIPAANI